MATSEALIKYYDCLRDSFSKIQDKDNKTTLVNAALRPKIEEELLKSNDLLVSYLNYVQVFSIIYSDKFINICNSVLVPFLKYKQPNPGFIQEYCNTNDVDTTKTNAEQFVDEAKIANKIHDTINTIIKGRPDLVEDFVYSMIKVFPGIPTEFDDENSKFELAYLTFLSNSLKVCTYLDGEPLVRLVIKILDRFNYPLENIDSEKLERSLECIDKSHEIVYSSISQLTDIESYQKISKAIIIAFTKEFLLRKQERNPINYLILYLCSLHDETKRYLLDQLWETFIDPNRSQEERRGALNYASSFLARATYVDLVEVFEFLEKSANWCSNFLKNRRSNEDANTSGVSSLGETAECFYATTQAMFYLVTQRYREMYEQESIDKLCQMNFDAILDSSFKPLEHCDQVIEQRFQEVAVLYNITNSTRIRTSLARQKRRRTSSRENTSSKRVTWVAPLAESSTKIGVPARVKRIYKNYYDHRNFTVFRD